MKRHCRNNGISLEYTIPYTPELNGVAERYNQTLMNKSRCLLLGCGLPKGLWTEAIAAAVYIINRTPTLALTDKVPAEVWYGEKPNLSKLRVFGCLAYLKVPKQLIRGKFEPRSEKYYMVGYCPNAQQIQMYTMYTVFAAYLTCILQLLRT